MSAFDIASSVLNLLHAEQGNEALVWNPVTAYTLSQGEEYREDGPLI